MISSLVIALLLSLSGHSDALQCQLVAAHVFATQNYTSTARACLGEEDDPRVSLALDYGQTPEVYAISEQLP